MTDKVKCIICSKNLADISNESEHVNGICDKCLDVMEKSEARTTAMLLDYKERLQPFLSEEP